MTKERQRLLDELGFVWQVRNRTTWDVRFQELVRFKEVNGTTIVPQQQYKLFLKGEHSFLTPDRREQLESIGFIWSMKGRGVGSPRGSGGGDGGSVKSGGGGGTDVMQQDEKPPAVKQETNPAAAVAAAVAAASEPPAVAAAVAAVPEPPNAPEVGMPMMDEGTVVPMEDDGLPTPLNAATV
eukprot:CAMPEP_0116563002 /NCGR_PEP_ID=MMETSP0397-20121206/12482_1 /TAXON_ID=216820 /ORGANISM="Cyclophora tenuis, Strain ECT3854" /LENGTH=181 /DNA_ID=CAMNT_0004089379 /DNA_START=1 /DNA_END=546 /DNA_ORIENTATION=+